MGHITFYYTIIYQTLNQNAEAESEKLRIKSICSIQVLLFKYSWLTDRREVWASLLKQKFCQFAGLEHSGVLTQCQGGKTSAMILKKQLFLPINLGKVIRSFPNYSESITRQRERLFTSGKHSRQQSIFPGVDVPASSPQGQKPKSYISDSTGLS